MALPVTIVDMARELNWDKRTCGIILSSFFWGYILPQVVGGRIADRHGGDRVLWTAGFMWSLAGLCTVYLAYVSTLAMFTIRFVAGMTQGVHYPALVGLVAKRIDPKERSFYYGVIGVGTSVGSILLSIVAPFLISLQGWPLVFITFGVLGVMWAILLRAVSMDSCSGSHQTKAKAEPVTDSPKHGSLFSSVPWKQVLLNMPVLSSFLVHFSDAFLAHNLLSWAPTYFHDTFPSQKGSAWIYNSLPWLGVGSGTLMGGWLVHKLADTCGLGMTLARKVMVGIGLGIPSLCFLALAATEQKDVSLNFLMANVFLFVACFGHGLLVTGPTMNLTDMYPDHSGSLYGVMNTIGTLPGMLGVTLTGYILHQTSSWPLVFCIMALINVPSLAAYLMFSKSTRLHLEMLTSTATVD